MPVRERQAFTAHAPMLSYRQTVQSPDRSGDLSYPGGLHHRRAALALCEAGSLIFVGVNAAELFPIGVKYADEEMVMLTAAILVKGSLAPYPRFFRFRFCHVGHPIGRSSTLYYRKGASVTQVPEKIVTRALLQQKNEQTHSRNLPKNRQTRRLFPVFPEYSFPAFVNGLFQAIRMMEPAGQFVLKIVASHETFFDFQRLY